MMHGRKNIKLIKLCFFYKVLYVFTPNGHYQTRINKKKGRSNMFNRQCYKKDLFVTTLSATVIHHPNHILIVYVQVSVHSFFVMTAYVI